MPEQKKRKKESPPVSAKARAKAKSRALVLFYMLVLLGIAVGAVLMCIFVFFKVSTINVTGTAIYSPKELVVASGIRAGDNLVFTDTAAVEKKLFKQFPYIERVRVQKKIPSGIDISVSEAQAYYSVAYNGQYVYVSRLGKMLEMGAEPKENSVLVKVGEVSDAEGYLKIKDKESEHIFSEIRSFFEEREQGGVTEIDLSNIHKINITYDNRVKIELGNSVDLVYKIDFALQIIDRGGVKEDERGTLDLSLGKKANKAYFTQEALPATPAPDKEENGDAKAPDSGESEDSKADEENPEATPTPPADPSTENVRGGDIPDVN